MGTSIPVNSLKQKVERKTFKFWIIVKKAVPWAILVALYASLFIYVLSFRTTIGYWFLALVSCWSMFLLSMLLSLSSNYYQTFYHPYYLATGMPQSLQNGKILSQKSYLKAINASVVAGITLVGVFNYSRKISFLSFKKTVN